MRLILLILLLAVAVSGGFLGNVKEQAKEVLGKESKFVQKLKSGFQKFLDETGLSKIADKFKKVKEKIVKTLKLSPELLKSLKERLKNLRLFKRNRVQEVGDSVTEINAFNKVENDFYQADIALTSTQADEIITGIEQQAGDVSRPKRQAFKDSHYPSTLWFEGVNYFFDPAASKKVRSVFVKATKLWEKDTCINFKEDSSAKDKIMVFPNTGCWSYVGRIGGQQNLSLGNGCESVGTAAHELGHALGFFHTMSRYDRDKFITVNTENIKPDWVEQFNKETKETNENYGMTYDYGSIMHYGGTSATANQKPTMVPFDIFYQQTLGSPFISFIELSMLNEHYHCKERCDPATSVKCEMGGFPHPRDCKKCICPGGYAGDRCTERPAGCGAIIKASPEWQELEDIVGPGTEEQEDFYTCNYWLESPPDTLIEVRILDFTGGVSVDGCPYAGVEIKTNKDQTLTGYRFCSPDAAGMELRSYTNRVPIITWNRVYKTETVLEFRYVSSSGKPMGKDNKDKKVRPPVITGNGFKCVDHKDCSFLAAEGFCKMNIPKDIKLAKCPKACHFC
ncbi:hypothetical protein V3C99_012437 [Haemonchus contortus]|uniref:Metalloendopeptidase n=1 Tax=Haemonchus contortus TaxID=6289 RepID=A0A7I4Y5K4_HAECO